MTQSRRRLVVTGRNGQVARAILERRNDDRFEFISLSRPELNLSAPEAIEPILQKALPDVIVSAAAYTAVDLAETDEASAMIINGVAPGRIANVAASLNIPIIHLSTDYVFDGKKPVAYNESDWVSPLGAYGRTKLAGERAIAQTTANHVILRTAWIYSPFGKNFVKTMMTLAENREHISVVDDQIGNPTSALDIADGILSVAENLLSSDREALRGTFHMSGSGEASWADFAEEIFAQYAVRNGPRVNVIRISSDQYPTAAKRPSNSRLDCSRIASLHGIRMPAWKDSLSKVLDQLT